MLGIGLQLSMYTTKPPIDMANTEKHKLSFIEIVDRKRALP
jgi:hypothetical protein